VLAKEYSTKPSARTKEKTAVKKVSRETTTYALEEPSDTEAAATGKKKSIRKTIA
jgi:hypothetical protein